MRRRSSDFISTVSSIGRETPVIVGCSVVVGLALGLMVSGASAARLTVSDEDRHGNAANHRWRGRLNDRTSLPEDATSVTAELGGAGAESKRSRGCCCCCCSARCRRQRTNRHHHGPLAVSFHLSSDLLQLVATILEPDLDLQDIR